MSERARGRMRERVLGRYAAPLSVFALVLAASGTVPSGRMAAQVAAGAYPHGTFPEGVECLDCHTTEGWSPIQEDPVFDHEEVTGFPLVGRHADASCRSCHQDLHFEKVTASPEECGTCHQDVHGGSLPANCSLCHTPTAFHEVDGVGIHQRTGFPLEGAHLQVSCESCHADDEGGSFRPLPTDCQACHQEDYESSQLVDHVALDFPTVCLICHTPRSWMDIGAFDHASFSGGYRLQGAHRDLQCTACHVPGGDLLFAPLGEEDCAACHQADYQREHAGSGYPQTCTQCHGQDTWDRDDFDHAQVSGGYALVGAHVELACTSCHTPDGSGLLLSPSDQNDCVACHLADYHEEHSGTGYPTTCLACHTVDTWDGAISDHAALSGGFGLVGDHDALACTSCHTPDISDTFFDPTAPDDCIACHQADYQGEHAGSGYPTTCLTCHTIDTWRGAATDHSALSGGFNLVGDHGQLPCSSCHILPGMESLFTPIDPEDCLACHLGDFQREHSGSGYPTTCLTCHLVLTWAGAQFDHDGDFFPIYSGKHQGRWSSCQTCHTSPGDYAVLTCLNCHEHNQAQTDRDHSEVSGYVYESGQCLSCHPTGRS